MINVPSVEGFAQPRTRRDFFKALAAAGAGVALGSTVLSGKAFAQSGGGDVDIANFALTLEYLEAEFYTIAVDSGVVSEVSLPTVTNLRDHELAHVDAIIGLLEGAGATPVEKPEFTFPEDAFSSEASILELAATFEPVGVGAYQGAAPALIGSPYLGPALSIHNAEAQHVTAINILLGVDPPNNIVFTEALPLATVQEAVAPFGITS